MKRHFNIAAISLSLFIVWGAAALGAAGAVGPQDVKAVVGLIKYLYAGYDNGANDRKSFFDTIPWDPEAGRLVDRVRQCERKEGVVIDIDWPSDSQDPVIKNLSVVYSGSRAPKHTTVRASFQSFDQHVVIDYDMHLYDEAPLPRRWGVSNIRIHDDHGTNDLLQTLHQALTGDCKAF